MTKADITTLLLENQDLKYREFQKKLIPGTENIIGIRMPVLQKLAKQIARGDYHSFLEDMSFEYYEQSMLYGLVLGSIGKDFATVFHYTKKFVPTITNWGVCDSLCTKLKEANKHREELLPYIIECCRDNREFVVRFGVVMLMCYYIDPLHLDIIFKEYNSINTEAYYVRMGIAWSVSFCYVRYPQRTFEYLQNNNLDDWTHNKAIQKIRESLRVSAQDKELVNGLKRKTK